MSMLLVDMNVCSTYIRVHYMYFFVCTHVTCMYVYMYIECMYVCMYVNMYVWLTVCTGTSMLYSVYCIYTNVLQ